MREDRDLMNCLNGLPTDDEPLTDAEMDSLTRTVLQRTRRQTLRKVRGRKRHWPVWGRVLVSGAACAMMLVGLNGINPALAEGLPLLGNVFAYINALPKGYLQSEQLSDYAQSVQVAENSAPAGVQQDSLPKTTMQMAAPQEAPYTITLSQVYCDELYLRVGLIFTAQDDSLAQFDGVTIDPPLLWEDTSDAEANTLYGGVTLNGESVGGDLVPYFRKQDDHTFVCEMDYNLQNYTGDKQDMQASLTFTNLVGVTEGSEEKVPLDGSYSLNFTVSADGTLTREGQMKGGEQNGIRPVSLTATPGETRLQYAAASLPEEVNPYPQILLEDGTALEWVRGTPDENEENGETVWTYTFDAVPEGTTQLQVRVVDKNSEELAVLAEWTVSLPQ